MRNLGHRKVNQPDQDDKDSIRTEIQTWLIWFQRPELRQLYSVPTVTTTASNITTAITTATTLTTTTFTAASTTTSAMAITPPIPCLNLCFWRSQFLEDHQSSGSCGKERGKVQNTYPRTTESECYIMETKNIYCNIFPRQFLYKVKWKDPIICNSDSIYMRVFQLLKYFNKYYKARKV